MSRQSATITAITDISPDCRQYTLELESGTFSGHPGQHTSIKTPDSGVKPYSVLAVNETQILLMLRAYGTGGVADYMNARQVGDTVAVESRLSGNLTLQSADRPAVFIGTGTGITPLIGLLHQYVTYDGPDAVFMFGEKTRDQLLYKSLLEQYAVIHPVSLRFSLSRESWPGHEGYIQDQLDEVVAAASDNTDYYACGVPAAVVGAKDRLQELGVADGHIYTEGWEDAHVS